MNTLPDELLLNIVSYLDVEPPSVKQFSQDPKAATKELTQSDDTPLKALSATSARLRRIASPLLFKHSRIHLDSKRKWIRLDENLASHCERNLEKLNRDERRIYLQLRQRHDSSNVWEDTVHQRIPLDDEDRVLAAAPTAITYLGLSEENLQFIQFLIDQELQHQVKSLVVYSDHDLEALGEGDLSPTQQREYDWTRSIWKTIFRYLDPVRLIIAAPPNTVGGLAETWSYALDSSAFEMQTHYLELTRTRRPQQESQLNHAVGCCRHKSPWLLNMKPWNRLAYNEGSSVFAYSHYEHYSKQTPLILSSILSRLAIDVGNCCNLESFSFVACFPISGNVNNISNELYMLANTLSEIEIKLLPDDIADLLNDTKRLRRALYSDLWLEWEESYSSILSALEFAGKETRFVTHDSGYRDITIDPGSWKIESTDQSSTRYCKTTPRTQIPDSP